MITVYAGILARMVQGWAGVWYFCSATTAHLQVDGDMNPREMGLRGWATDESKSGIQGITDDEVSKLVSDLERMVPQQAQKWVDWVQTKEHGRRR